MKRYGSEICVALLLAVVISCFGGVIVYASSAENQITDQMDYKKEIIEMVEKCTNNHWIEVIYIFVKRLIG